MTSRDRIETVAFKTPTHEQTQRIVAEARRLRAEAVATLLSRAWSALSGRFQSGRPAHTAH